MLLSQVLEWKVRNCLGPSPHRCGLKIGRAWVLVSSQYNQDHSSPSVHHQPVEDAMLPGGKDARSVDSMIFNLLDWLTSKDVVEIGLQAALLVATCGLIVVGYLQTRTARAQAEAALSQANAANEQVIAAREQAEAAKIQLRELLSQGIAARRPFFVMMPRMHATTTETLLVNQGPGIAFKVTWKFLDEHTYTGYDALGTVGVNVPVVLAYNTPQGHKLLQPEEVHSHVGVRLDYEDSAGKAYTTVITRTPEGGFVSDIETI